MKKTILIVDQGTEARSKLMRILEHDQIEFSEVENEHEAMLPVKKKQTDTFVSKTLFSGASALDLSCLVGSRFSQVRIKFVFLTVDDRSENKSSSRKCLKGFTKNVCWDSKPNHPAKKITDLPSSEFLADTEKIHPAIFRNLFQRYFVDSSTSKIILAKRYTS